MRIDRLDLLRFGKFTDRAIALPRARQDFHLVVGANEAGKSTIAEALRYALFEPSKPIYDARKSIQQRSGSETPEVDVDLQVEDQRWRIEKRDR